MISDKLIDRVFAQTRCKYCKDKIDRYEGDHGYTRDIQGFSCEFVDTSFAQVPCNKSDSMRCPIFSIRNAESMEKIKDKYLNEVTNDL